MTLMPAPSPAKKPSTFRWQKRLPWVGALLLTVLIAVGLWPRAIPVESGTVQRAPLAVTVDEEGMTRVKNRYVLSAPVAGQLRRIDWKAGANIDAGQTVLAVLEPSGVDFLDARSQAQAEARVRAADAAREAAAAQRTRAAATARLSAAELERAKRLRATEVLSAQEYDVAQLRAETATQDLRAAEFTLKVAEFELQQAQALLIRGQPSSPKPEQQAQGVAPLFLTSPVSGKILRVMQESARVVPAGFPLMEVGDPTDLEVRIEVLSRDGVAIRPAAKVILEQWGGSMPLLARVRLVEPSAFTKISALGVEEQRVYVIADFTDPVDVRPTLGDAFRVEARIVTWENGAALQAPSGALFQRGGTWQTFVIEGGRARLRTIQPGRSNGVATEIREGLQQDDRVIVYPGDKVQDGSRVSPLVIDRR